MIAESSKKCAEAQAEGGLSIERENKIISIESQEETNVRWYIKRARFVWGFFPNEMGNPLCSFTVLLIYEVS